MNQPKKILLEEGDRFILIYDNVPIVDEQMAKTIIKLARSSFQNHLRFTSCALKSLACSGAADVADIESATIFIQMAALAKGYR